MIKILLVSSFEPWSLGLSYLRAFQQLGQEIACFDMAVEYERSSPLTRNRYTNRLIMPFACRVMNKKLLVAANDFKPDLIFVHKGSLIHPETIGKLNDDTHASLYIFNPDDPFNPNGGASSKLARSSIPLYDAYFIWSKALIPKLKEAGAKNVFYLPFAADMQLHYPVKLKDSENGQYITDISFIGNWDEEREKWLGDIANSGLSIWGTDYWKQRCKNKRLRAAWRKNIIYGEEMSRSINGSKINLNILRLQNKGSHNMRTFEIPACGGFMLHERSEEIFDFFNEGEDIACFSTPTELKEKVDYYLLKDELRKGMAERALEKVQKHTYTERIKNILEVYEKEKKA